MPWVGRRGRERMLPTSVWQRDPQLEVVEALVRNGPAVDIGAGGRLLAPRVITVDAVAYPGTRVVADIVRLPFRQGVVASLVCTGTLEHVPDPPRAVLELARVLAPAGVAHIEVPFMQPFHADPHDYWRFSDQGLAVLFRRWNILEQGCHMGSGTGAAWVLQEAAKAPFSRRPVRMLVHMIVVLLTQPLRLLDRRDRPPGPSASGYYLRATPPLR